MENNNNFGNSGKMMETTDDYVEVLYTAFKLCKNYLLFRNKIYNIITNKKIIMNIRNKK